jgi:hypothetical protein
MAYNAQPFVGDKYLADAGQKAAALDLSGTKELTEGIKDAGKAVGEYLKSADSLKKEDEYLKSQYEAMAEIGKEYLPQAFGDEAVGKFHSMSLGAKRGHVAQMGSFLNTFVNQKLAQDAAAQGNVYDLSKIAATGNQSRMTQELENQGKKEVAEIAAKGNEFTPYISRVTKPDGSMSLYYHKPSGQGTYEDEVKAKLIQGQNNEWHLVNELNGQYLTHVQDPNDPNKAFMGKSEADAWKAMVAGRMFGDQKTSTKEDRMTGAQAAPSNAPQASGSPAATPNIGKMPLSQIPKGARYKENGQWKIKE